MELGFNLGLLTPEPWLVSLQLHSSKSLSGLTQFTFQGWVYSGCCGRDRYAFFVWVGQKDFFGLVKLWMPVALKSMSNEELLEELGLLSLEERRMGHWTSDMEEAAIS